MPIQEGLEPETVEGLTFVKYIIFKPSTIDVHSFMLMIFFAVLLLLHLLLLLVLRGVLISDPGLGLAYTSRVGVSNPWPSPPFNIMSQSVATQCSELPCL